MKHKCSDQTNNEGNNLQSAGNSNKASQWHKGTPYVHPTQPVQTKVWQYSDNLGEFVSSKCRVSSSVTCRELQQWCSGRINHQSRGPPIWHLQGQRTVQGEGLLATLTWSWGKVFLEGGGGRGRYQPDRARKAVHKAVFRLQSQDLETTTYHQG